MHQAGERLCPGMLLNASHLLPWATCLAYIPSFNPHDNVLNEVGVSLTILQVRKLGVGVGSKSLCNCPKAIEHE